MELLKTNGRKHTSELVRSQIRITDSILKSGVIFLKFVVILELFIFTPSLGPFAAE